MIGESEGIPKIQQMFARWHEDEESGVDPESEEFLEFDRIVSPRHPRPDLCAFLMLHDLIGGDEDIVVSAEHDQIWLAVDAEKLAEVATDEQIRDLVRCGVMYDDYTESLSMFV